MIIKTTWAMFGLVLATMVMADWEISSSRVVSNQLILELSGASSTDTYTYTSSSSLFSNDWSDVSVRWGASNQLTINLSSGGLNFVSARYSSLEDADNDLILNQDEYEQGTDPEDADSDDDHVSDAADANPTINVDSDSDALGDDWEDYWFGVLTYDGDDDPDGDDFEGVQGTFRACQGSADDSRRHPRHDHRLLFRYRENRQCREHDQHQYD